MARTVVTNELIQKINELYYACKNYSQVGRELNLSPSTVKKYVVPGYAPAAEVVARSTSFSFIDMPDDWGAACLYTPEEFERMMDFRKEIKI